MKQLVVLSGKGGTGKTSLTAAFAHLAAEGTKPIATVLADADVDAANLELVLEPHVLHQEMFWGGKLAVIDPVECTGCGICVEVCRFDAIRVENGSYHVEAIPCEGCASCAFSCPEGAIQMEDQMAGHWFRSDSRFGPLFHAALRPAQENSGKLVTLVKQQARLLALDEARDLVLVDGPPGIGCPVISAVSGADLALIVAEPTAAGAHDMQRVLETAAHFGVPSVVCINKADLYPKGAEGIEASCEDQGVEVIGRIPYDLTVTEAMVQGEPVTAYRPDCPASMAVAEVWDRVKSMVLEVI